MALVDLFENSIVMDITKEIMKTINSDLFAELNKINERLDKLEEAINAQSKVVAQSDFNNADNLVKKGRKPRKNRTANPDSTVDNSKNSSKPRKKRRKSLDLNAIPENREELIQNFDSIDQPTEQQTPSVDSVN